MDLETPHVEVRAAVGTAGITRAVPMGRVGEMGRALGEVESWLAGHGLAPGGPPFFRYHTIDMAAELVIEAGFPLAPGAVPDDGAAGPVRLGTIPAGRYAVARHRGHPDELMEATARLLRWAADEALTFDHRPGPHGDEWAARLETYLTDPAEEPDMDRWETELAFRVVD